MSNNLPVTIQGLSVTNSGNGGAIALNQSQANQLLQKLRSIQTSGKKLVLIFDYYLVSDNCSEISILFVKPLFGNLGINLILRC